METAKCAGVPNNGAIGAIALSTMTGAIMSGSSVKMMPLSTANPFQGSTTTKNRKTGKLVRDHRIFFFSQAWPALTGLGTCAVALLFFRMRMPGHNCEKTRS